MSVHSAYILGILVSLAWTLAHGEELVHLRIDLIQNAMNSDEVIDCIVNAGEATVVTMTSSSLVTPSLSTAPKSAGLNPQTDKRNDEVFQQCADTALQNITIQYPLTPSERVYTIDILTKLSGSIQRSNLSRLEIIEEYKENLPNFF